MDGITELAKLFKERDNPSIMGIQIGKIINPFPDIKITLGDKIILDSDDLVVSETIYAKTIKISDQVILIPSFDEQTYYLIDKVVNL